MDREPENIRRMDLVLHLDSFRKLCDELDYQAKGRLTPSRPAALGVHGIAVCLDRQSNGRLASFNLV